MTSRKRLLLSYLAVMFMAVVPLVVCGMIFLQKPRHFYLFLFASFSAVILSGTASIALSRFFDRKNKEDMLERLEMIDRGAVVKPEDEADEVVQTIGAMVRRISRRVREDEQKLRIVFEISRIVSSLLHLQGVLDAIVDLLMREFRLDASAIRLIDEDGVLRVLSQQGLNEETLKQADQKPNFGNYAGECFLTGKIIIVNDAVSAAESRSMRDNLCRDMGSFALNPIVVEGKTIGVVSNCSRKKNYFHSRYNDVISVIGSQIGMAIRISQLYEEIYDFSQGLEKKVQERTERLEEKNRQLIEAEKDAAIGKMANRVAHEVRNSLAVVGGFSRRLYEKTREDDPIRTYLGIIVEEVKSLEDKVSGIIRDRSEEP
ncbi:MAG: GAF domain-containing protein [Desulfatiglandales bacterium]